MGSAMHKPHGVYRSTTLNSMTAYQNNKAAVGQLRTSLNMYVLIPLMLRMLALRLLCLHLGKLKQTSKLYDTK